ncbi:MAG: hypothetical protein IKZ47_01310 [Clostridia bacterium]|nr:hypothetical protein [Clostridia bacterium]
MNSIRVFVTAFCAGCILLGVLYILVPKGNMSKPVRFAVCLCFLLSLITAFTVPGIGDIPDFLVSSADFRNEQLSAEAARAVFASALNSANIEFSKISVFTDKSGSGGINITKVYVYSGAKPEDIKNVIGSDDYELVVINE